MLAIHAGRTREDHADLLAATGFTLLRKIDSRVGLWIREARTATGERIE
jgi:hypothetical protein